MNCEYAQEQIVAAAYGDLQAEPARELERHVAGCPGCQAEQEQVLALKSLAASYAVAEPDPNLIARARLNLDEALDALPPRRWYERLGERLLGNFNTLESAPAAALLLVAVGGGAGVLGGYRYAQVQTPHAAMTAQMAAPAGARMQPADAVPELANVASVSAIERRPDSGIVDVSYNQMVPRRIEGAINDPSIQQLLMLATEHAATPGVRDDSVALLAAECRASHSCQHPGIREALLAALRTDRNPRVRQKALEGLKPYIAADERVRNAVLEAVLGDNDPSIRSAAIGSLEPVEADTSVRQVLYSVSNSDNNPRIRYVSRQVLSRVPEIQ
jgi:hypothetical protein